MKHLRDLPGARVVHRLLAMLEDTVTTVRRVRRNAHTLKIFRRPSLDDLLPRHDLATADTVRSIAVAPCRQAARPTMIIRRPTLRRRSAAGWWAVGVTLALASLIVVATMRDRDASAVARVSAPMTTPSTQIDDDPAPLTVEVEVEVASETPSMTLAGSLPAAKPVKSLKRAKRAPVKNRARTRWNPDSLFLPK